MIRLSTFENNSFEPFHTLSQQEYDLLKKDCDLIKANYKQFVVFKYLQLNLKDYFKFVADWTNFTGSSACILLSSNAAFILEVNKLILNVLVGFKFFLDNAETYLKRKFGKDSLTVIEFTKLTNECYDSSFAYRFLSKLRNFSAHLGFPLEVIHFKINFNHENPESSTNTVQLILNLDMLKKEKALFGNVMKDLNLIEEKLDLIPLINELSHFIIILQKYIYKVQKNEIDEAIFNIDFFVANKKTKTNQIKTYTLSDAIGNKREIEIYDIPCEIIDEINISTKNWC